MPLTAKALKDTALLQLFTASMWRSQFKCQFLWEELTILASQLLALSPFHLLSPKPSSARALQICFTTVSYPQHTGLTQERTWGVNVHTAKQIQYGYLHFTWIFKIKLENPMMSSLPVLRPEPHTPCVRRSPPVFCGTLGNSAWEVLGLDYPLVTF